MKIAMFIAMPVLCYLVGWWHAHSVIASECERLGGFYVGQRTFRCVVEDSE